MGYIYKIFNDINDKVYIGQTKQTVHDRWRQHKSAALTEKDVGVSAIHDAIRKYGVEKFHIEQIEECQDSLLNNREIYYISLYNCISPNGYNLTMGGGGRQQTDYDKIVEQYYECNQNQNEVARKYGYNISTIQRALKSRNIQVQKNYEKQGVQIYECDVDNNILRIFNNITEIIMEYPELEMTNRGLNHYLSMQSTRANNYRGKYFCRAREYDDYKTKNHHSKVKYQPVCCKETGMEFEKLADAARWVKEEYPEYKGSIDTIAANISKAIKNNHNSYKHSWYFLNLV